MVGLGETDEEIEEAMGMIREAGVDMITLGQYLQPSYSHLPVDRFPEPERFADWDRIARDLGFRAVASGPLVRSSLQSRSSGRKQWGVSQWSPGTQLVLRLVTSYRRRDWLLQRLIIHEKWRDE